MTAICRDVAALRRQVSGWRAGGQRVALVPTMGALHTGHLSLVERARKLGERVVVTIFVNPTQFAPGEDFSSYPRDLARDEAAVCRVGADLVYAPELDGMYPPGFASRIEVAGPAAAGLEDAFRPGHFAGVATIVVKLLMQAQPDAAIFGEKDFQQLKLIERVVRDLDVPVEIAAGATVREPDGLAMSSRNVYLDGGERACAPRLHSAIVACAYAIAGGVSAAAACSEAIGHASAAGFVVDYIAARDAATLGPLVAGQCGRVLAAARLGRTRLIDNVAIPPSRALPARR